MSNNPASTVALDRAEAAARRLDEWRSHLMKLASGSITEIQERTFLGRELRAAATVAAMAELEALLRDMLVSICSEINNAAVEVRELVPSLRSLAANGGFDSLTNSADHGRRWEQRLVLTQLDTSTAIAQLPGRISRGPQPPLDGRTIQPRQIFLTWEVLGLSNPVPSASIVASLKKLTQIRNDVAHRNVEIHEVFAEAGRTASEISRYLDDIILLVLHIGNEWGAYLEGARYRAGVPAT